MTAATIERVREQTQKAQPYCDLSIFLPSEFLLESGERLRRPELKVRVFGDLENPAVAVTGGISAGRAVADCKDGPGWWRDLVAPDGFVDIDQYCVIGFDFLPNAGEEARTITTRDHARAFADALDVLSIEKLYAFIGASYGGMVGLAFAAEFPERIEKLCAMSAPDRPHPFATALRGVQRRIVALAAKAGDPKAGVGLARQLAMITYRTPEEFNTRFDCLAGDAAGDPYDVCEYLVARGDAYVMDAQRYVTLSDSIDRHCVDAAAVKSKSLIIAATSDRLAPIDDLRRLAAAIDDAALVEISSLYGHDAFLKETDLIGPHVKKFLKEKKS